LPDARCRRGAVFLEQPGEIFKFQHLGRMVNRPLQFADDMARPPRFERGTICLEGRCSIQLSYGRTPKRRVTKGWTTGKPRPGSTISKAIRSAQQAAFTKAFVVQFL